MSFLRARDPGARCTGAGARTQWTVDGAEPIRIVLMPSEVVDTPCLTLVAWVGEASRLDPRVVLEQCGHLLEGAVVLRGGVYLFRVTVAMEQLDEDAIARWLDYAARQATALRADRTCAAIVRPDHFAWVL